MRAFVVFSVVEHGANKSMCLLQLFDDISIFDITSVLGSFCSAWSLGSGLHYSAVYRVDRVHGYVSCYE